MLVIRDVTKKFGKKTVLDGLSLTIPQGTVFGLLGTNGAGKSTLLRLLAGILRPDGGEIFFQEPEGKRSRNRQKRGGGLDGQRIFFQADDAYYFLNATPKSMGEFYAALYGDFQREGYLKRLEALGLPPEEKLGAFSKGMKKQVSFLLAISSGADHIFCDEVFDGLDPVVREAIGALIRRAARERGVTFLVASHNLRELEAICDRVGILHAGGLLVTRDVSQHPADILELFKQEMEGTGYDIRALIP